jgi:hypothetical protein
MTDALIDAVLAQITDDVEFGDLTAIEELIKHVPEAILRGYLTCTSPEATKNED